MKKDTSIRNEKEQQPDDNKGSIITDVKTTAQHKAEWQKVLTAVRAEKKKIQVDDIPAFPLYLRHP